ncbi:3'-5' exoribonuclease YhaM family protein [Desulfocurvibacter africanus]|uniref:Metal dependent phosphohydrolase n=1 Tax=Desulfocurvibacter africanus subsp. africanus str. Walvis Bay TaxID=690850 RepID=F3YY08_DESAF|nr:HD domain-containing protein [Desulfocurvibacter africanus]EGJ50710.1 metal dependent phosphohydrolase [Desulfocurvibacter africanus subsp. africanus str. Walvis Bay]
MRAKKTFIRDMQPGHFISDVFVLAEARQAQGKNGPFWGLKLQDSSGSLEAKVFSPLSQQYPNLTAGNIVVAEGAVQLFRDQPQVIIERLELLACEPDETLLRGLIPCSKVDPEILLEELEDLLRQELRHGPWKKFCKRVLADQDIRGKLLFAPGAKAIHHAYAGGLLEHTLAVCRICQSLCGLYPELDREVLLAAAAFHDLGKAWELSSGLLRDYTDEGRLLGHIAIGLEKLLPHLAKVTDLDDELKAHFKHLLLSHHGELEFGSPKRPKTSEALVLHYADNLDAKLKTVSESLGEDTAEGAWSPFVRSLDRYLFHPKATPGSKNTRKDDKGPAQCLLPLKG